MLGTYALSAGYYDAYYGKAQKVRTLICRDFAAAYEQFDLLLSPTSPTTAFRFGEKTDDPLSMYLNDVCTIPTNLAGHPAMSVPFGVAPTACPSACSCWPPPSARPPCSGPRPSSKPPPRRSRRPTHERNLTHEPIEGEHFTVTSESTGDVWEIVVGLEVHCELATATKLFCCCPNQFGYEPNTNVCPVCLGLPGSLPVVNHQVVELAMRLGRALNCTVEPSVFARKNYFYPDMPKDYQVTQFDQPINVDGWLDLPDGTRVGIERAHIEEDTGKNSHAGGSGRIHGADYSLVDYNRAGVPLVEIVGRPHIRHPEQAKAYVDELRAILLATGVSDAKMEEGSLRVDANVSVRRVGDPELGTRCEIKNLNSLRSLGRAIEYEARRQVDLLESGERVKQETRHWDEGAGRTRPGRSKEEAEDYRYFQEPDLVPLAPSAEWVAAIDAAMPSLPAARRTAWPRPPASSRPDRRGRRRRARPRRPGPGGHRRRGRPARVLIHVEHNLAVDGAEALDPAHFAHSSRSRWPASSPPPRPRRCSPRWSSPARPPTHRRRRGFEAMDTAELEGIVDGIIAENPEEWADYCGGDDKRRGKLRASSSARS